MFWARFRAGEFEDCAVRPWVKVIWSLAGEGVVRLSGRTHRLPAGSVAVFLPGMRHEAWAGDDSPHGWETRWVTMDGPLCGTLAWAVGVRQAGVYAPSGDLRPLFEKYRRGLAAATPHGAQEAEVAAYELLVNLGSGAAVGSPLTDPVAAEGLSLFRLHWPDAAFGVAQAATRIGVHRSAFSRRFHAATGISPQRHLADLRMGHALGLLHSTDLSIKEIAVQCGFTDASYFTRLFHHTQGTSPGRYRSVGG